MHQRDPAKVLYRMARRMRFSFTHSVPKATTFAISAYFVVLLCIILSLYKWPDHYPQAGILLGMDLVIMAMLGGVVSAHSPKHLYIKALYIAVFFVSSVIGLRLVVQQAKETDTSAKELNDTLKNIALSSAETARVQQLNTELQERLLEQSKTISNLARKGIDATTGGDGFLYLTFGNLAATSQLFPSFVLVGNYTLYNVELRLVDVAASPHTEKYLKLGDVSANSSRTLQRPVFNGVAHKIEYNIFYSARNGFWSQELRLRSIEGKWKIASRVTRHAGKTDKLLFQQIDAEYPRNRNGSIEW